MRRHPLWLLTLVLALLASTALTTPAGATYAPCLGATIVGTPRSDFLLGTAKRDIIRGRGGDDVILGLGGGDIICGNGGEDRLDGGDGSDLTYGGVSIDRCKGEYESNCERGGP